METMKIYLVLLLVFTAVAPLSFAFHEASHSSSLLDDNSQYSFFGGDSSEAMTEDSRRQLFQYGFVYNKEARKRFLSYYALSKNNIPCGRRGTSYYDCKKRRRINPYRRGCAAITGCARFTD
ncbi:rapid alkalinization factor 23-like [Cucurbita moschata]|uniref:Rapid alkalinization factor 23-like n=1 Tax=Cucurbita moschata TaxID=3662 RepID=A0A6J1EIG3_CUCMO|nr:rapid alkalinization factor 23-like [Cucurbita moschata]